MFDGSWLIVHGSWLFYYELSTMNYQPFLIQIIQLHFQVFYHAAVGAEEADADTDYK